MLNELQMTGIIKSSQASHISQASTSPTSSLTSQSSSSSNSSSKRNSIDYGYESMLFSSSAGSSFHSSVHSSVSLSPSMVDFSQPSTPVKNFTTTTSNSNNNNNNNMSNSSSKRFSADINGIYLATLRSDASPAFKYQQQHQQQQQQHHGYFSTITSASNSPTHKTSAASAADTYLTEHDTFNKNLLRSPAFKASSSRATYYPFMSIDSPSPRHTPNSSSHQQQHSQQRPVIKSLNARFQANNLTPSPPPPPPQTTPALCAHEEFMDILIRNRHVPNNQSQLIGWHMGLEHVDVVSELAKRNMRNVLDQIFGYLAPGDYVRMACVSAEWRRVIADDRRVNTKRRRHIRRARNAFETSKENRSCGLDEWATVDAIACSHLGASGGAYAAKLSGEEKRRLLKTMTASSRTSMSSESGGSFSSSNSSLDTPPQSSSSSFIFGPLDVNRVNKWSDEKRLIDELVRTVKSNSARSSIGASSSIETSFDHISLMDTASGSAPLGEVANTPRILSTFKRLSPAKKQALLSLNEDVRIVLSPPKGTSKLHLNTAHTSANNKIDLIGSKKSKKNLKRL